MHIELAVDEYAQADALGVARAACVHTTARTLPRTAVWSRGVEEGPGRWRQRHDAHGAVRLRVDTGETLEDEAHEGRVEIITTYCVVVVCVFVEKVSFLWRVRLFSLSLRGE